MDDQDLLDPQHLFSICSDFQDTIPGRLNELYTHFLSKESSFLGRIVQKIENTLENEKSELQKAHKIGLSLALEDVADEVEIQSITNRYGQYLSKDFDNIPKYPKRLELAREFAIAKIEEGRFLIADRYEAVAEGKEPSELSYLQLDLLGEMISDVKDRTLLEFMVKIGESRSEDIPKIKIHLESISHLPSTKEKAADLRIWLRDDSVQELLRQIDSLSFSLISSIAIPEEITLFPSINSQTLSQALLYAAHNENIAAINEILRDERVPRREDSIYYIVMFFFLDSGNAKLLIELSKNPLFQNIDPKFKAEILRCIDEIFPSMNPNFNLSQEKINEFKKAFNDFF
jgi:hypothetical protein